MWIRVQSVPKTKCQKQWGEFVHNYFEHDRTEIVRFFMKSVSFTHTACVEYMTDERIENEPSPYEMCPVVVRRARCFVVMCKCMFSMASGRTGQFSNRTL